MRYSSFVFNYPVGFEKEKGSLIIFSFILGLPWEKRPENRLLKARQMENRRTRCVRSYPEICAIHFPRKMKNWRIVGGAVDGAERMRENASGARGGMAEGGGRGEKKRTQVRTRKWRCDDDARELSVMREMNNERPATISTSLGVGSGILSITTNVHDQETLKIRCCIAYARRSSPTMPVIRSIIAPYH